MKQVLTSWQVIAVVVVAILYIALVSYVARFRKRTGGPPPVKKALKLSFNKNKKPARTSALDDEDEEDRRKR